MIDEIRIGIQPQADERLLDTIVGWMYHWWGEAEGYEPAAVRQMMRHSFCTDRLPCTVVAWQGERPVGMYQFSYYDLDVRPDLYPWLCNVYVEESCRGQGIFRRMMETVQEQAKGLGIAQLYLFTVEEGLYERFGWVYEGQIETFLPGQRWQRLYRLKIAEESKKSPGI